MFVDTKSRDGMDWTLQRFILIKESTQFDSQGSKIRDSKNLKRISPYKPVVASLVALNKRSMVFYRRSFNS